MKIKNKLLELWVFNRAGVSLLHAKGPSIIDKKPLDPLLFTCYFSAIETIANGQMNAIVMKDSKLMISLNEKMKDLIFVGRSRPEIKERKIKETLKQISDQLVSEFHQNLKHWTGEIAQFSQFQDKVALLCCE